MGSAAAHGTRELRDDAPQLCVLRLLDDGKRPRQGESGGEHCAQVACKEDLLVFRDRREFRIPNAKTPPPIRPVLGKGEDAPALAPHYLVQFKSVTRLRGAFVYFPIALFSGIRKLCHAYSI